EAATFIDQLSTGFELGIVALSLAVLVRPALASQKLRPNIAAPSFGLAVIAVAVFSSLAVAPAFATGAGGGHTHGGSAEAACTSGAAHAGHGAIVSNAPTGDTQCEQSGPPASAGQISSAGGHGHRGPIKWENITDRATRDQLGAQLDIAHQVTLQFP